MNNPKKKDGLTELIDIAVSQPTDQKPNNGVVSTPSGDTVTLEVEIDAFVRKFVKDVKQRKTQEREAIEQVIRKKYKKS